MFASFCLELSANPSALWALLGLLCFLFQLETSRRRLPQWWIFWWCSLLQQQGGRVKRVEVVLSLVADIAADIVRDNFYKKTQCGLCVWLLEDLGVGEVSSIVVSPRKVWQQSSQNIRKSQDGRRHIICVLFWKSCNEQDYMGGAHSINFVGTKKLSRAVADLVYGWLDNS